jgi:hypothetical protein
MGRILFPSVSYPALPYVTTLSRKWHDFREKSSCKEPVIIFRFQWNWNFVDEFSKDTVPNFMRICPLGRKGCAIRYATVDWGCCLVYTDCRNRMLLIPPSVNSKNFCQRFTSLNLGSLELNCLKSWLQCESFDTSVWKLRSFSQLRRPVFLWRTQLNYLSALRNVRGPLGGQQTRERGIRI